MEIGLVVALILATVFAVTVSLADRRRAKQIQHDLAETRPRYRRRFTR